jgi:glycosyltransferase involved in cell wall biosynthesis
MKIYTANSARGSLCQIQRIERGFIELGHEITPFPHLADIIYQNNAWFDGIIQDKQRGNFKKGAKIVFTVLDCAAHLPDFPIDKLQDQLKYADAICTISEYVRGDLKQKTGFDSTVISQPIMPVSYTGIKTCKYKYLAAGRVTDFNKRLNAAIGALSLLGVTNEELGVVGGENMGVGESLGVVDHETLNNLYNSADFLLCPSKCEGILLPCVEAMATKTIPIICSDLTTRQELLPSELFPEYDHVEVNPVSIAMFIAKYLQDNQAMNEFKERLYAHYKNNLEEKFSGINVAKRILEVYNNL